MILQVVRLVNPKAASTLLGLAVKPNIGSLSRPTLASNVIQNHIRCISSLKFRDKSVTKPAPWPYKKKKYTYLHALFDYTENRFDENTRLILVEGNVGVGKSSIAKALAEELGMHYIAEPSVDSLYKDDYGLDFRSLDPYLPKSMESCDLKRFYTNPHHRNVGAFQMQMYGLRLEQYMNGLAHLLNTGDGVILERSPYSDFVFVEAMHKMGYISDGVRWYYNEARYATLTELVRPHLVLYFDAPVDVLMKRIKARNDPIEVNSKVLTKEYLETIEHHYKQDFLKEISQHSELLVYDWSEYGDLEAVVEDIERIDFNKYDQYDLKLREWRHTDRWYWNNMRRKYTNEKSRIFGFMELPHYDVEELFIPFEDLYEAQNLYEHLPTQKFDYGFNPVMGDKGYLFKMEVKNYWEKQKYSVIHNK